MEKALKRLVEFGKANKLNDKETELLKQIYEANEDYEMNADEFGFEQAKANDKGKGEEWTKENYEEASKEMNKTHQKFSDLLKSNSKVQKVWNMWMYKELTGEEL